jgi:hypothetical protein
VHSLVRRFIKTGIAFLALGLALGVVLLLRRELWGVWPNPYLVSAHAHAVLAGFVIYLIFGVALWLFPRPASGDTRYRPERIRVAYWVLTTGTLLRIAGEAAHAWTPGRWLAWLVVGGGVAQVLGMGLFGWTMWGRIRPLGSHLREQRGERF